MIQPQERLIRFALRFLNLPQRHQHRDGPAFAGDSPACRERRLEQSEQRGAEQQADESDPPQACQGREERHGPLVSRSFVNGTSTPGRSSSQSPKRAGSKVSRRNPA